jgi:hypothetical protein
VQRIFTDLAAPDSEMCIAVRCFLFPLDDPCLDQIQDLINDHILAPFVTGHLSRRHLRSRP